jgi:hypothetical protein
LDLIVLRSKNGNKREKKNIRMSNLVNIGMDNLVSNVKKEKRKN